MRRQFYFHRFFSHQPDLNFENPAVHDAMFDIVRFWLDLGVDGFRLDAIPYLYESEEGNGEGEPPTHEFIKKLRAMVDREYPGRVHDRRGEPVAARGRRVLRHRRGAGVPHGLRLPGDAAHLLLAALAAGRRARAGALRDHRRPGRAPAGACSCATTTSSRSRWCPRSTGRRCTAGTPTTRGCASNIGIRRRLAPLLDNSRAELELAHALLFSLPGSPFLYYGDEIGMGDNIWLPDRDASRTPMQWTPDRNAGFSTADPGKLYLPVVQSLVYNYTLVNVESQLAQSRSLLHWVRNVIHVRKAHPAFGLGIDRGAARPTTSRCSPSCATYAGARARQFGDAPEDMLCVFSFAHNPVAVDDRRAASSPARRCTTCSAAASSRRSTRTAGSR